MRALVLTLLLLGIITPAAAREKFEGRYLPSLVGIPFERDGAPQEIPQGVAIVPLRGLRIAIEPDFRAPDFAVPDEAGANLAGENWPPETVLSRLPILEKKLLGADGLSQGKIHYNLSNSTFLGGEVRGDIGTDHAMLTLHWPP